MFFVLPFCPDLYANVYAFIGICMFLRKVIEIVCKCYAAELKACVSYVVYCIICIPSRCGMEHYVVYIVHVGSLCPYVLTYKLTGYIDWVTPNHPKILLFSFLAYGMYCALQENTNIILKYLTLNRHFLASQCRLICEL